MIQIKQRQGQPSPALSAALHPLLARIYAQRGVDHPQQLDYGLQYLTPYHDMAGMAAAISILAQAIAQQKHIVIVGDFDCDGATSTSLAYLALGAMGAHKVSYLVPNRFTYGYGLSAPLVDAAMDMAPEVIVTVDNGIASHEGVDRAHALGLQVVITDHHLAGDTLPKADAIVNPNQPNCPFPHKSTAGVGVIFYVMSALRRHLQEQGWFEQAKITAPNMAQFLDLVALGTVADLVPLEYNNRILVAQGMARIRRGLARPGILALVQQAGRQINQLQATDMGFVLGPRLNAAGRLDDMSVGIECLLTNDTERAQQLAQQLDELNQQRRSIEGEMQEQAAIIVSQLQEAEATQLPPCVCLFQPDWHEGVVGIVASRIKERWHRPSLVFAQGEDGFLKGSARSIPGFHIRDALAAVDAKYPHLIERFGGHAMAAGLSIAMDNLEAFKEALNAYAQEYLDPALLARTWRTDGVLQSPDLQLQQAQLLTTAGPWGQAFEAPSFHGDFELIQQRIVGQKHLKMVVAQQQGGELIDAICFNVDLSIWPSEYQRVRLVYRMDVNEFRGRQSLQLIVEAMAPL
jgi:single-stranded-DNA-specific exonuclease